MQSHKFTKFLKYCAKRIKSNKCLPSCMKCYSIYIVPQPQNNRACNIRLQYETSKTFCSCADFLVKWSTLCNVGNHSKNHPTWSLARYTSCHTISVFVKSIIRLQSLVTVQNQKFWNVSRLHLINEVLYH